MKTVTKIVKQIFKFNPFDLALSLSSLYLLFNTFFEIEATFSLSYAMLDIYSCTIKAKGASGCLDIFKKLSKLIKTPIKIIATKAKRK